MPLAIFFFRISVGFSCKPSVRVIFARRLMCLEEVMISYEGQDKTIKMIIFRLLVGLPEIFRKGFKLGDDLERHYAIKTPKWVDKINLMFHRVISVMNRKIKGKTPCLERQPMRVEVTVFILSVFEAHIFVVLLNTGGI